jgi:hypothetical protein
MIIEVEPRFLMVREKVAPFSVRALVVCLADEPSDPRAGLFLLLAEDAPLGAAARLFSFLVGWFFSEMLVLGAQPRGAFGDHPVVVAQPCAGSEQAAGHAQVHFGAGDTAGEEVVQAHQTHPLTEGLLVVQVAGCTAGVGAQRLNCVSRRRSWAVSESVCCGRDLVRSGV